VLPPEDGAGTPVRRLKGIWRFAVALSLGVAALIPIVQFAVIFPLTVNIPTWDQWDFIPVWRAHFSHVPVLPRLAEPYNGHIIFLPRFIFFALGLLTHWNVRVEIIFVYIACVCSLVLLLRMLAGTDPRLLVVSAPISAYLFYLDQSENFLTGIALCESMAVLGTVATIFFLTRRGLPRSRFGLALASAVAASLSWGIGIVAWPAGFLALLLRRERRRLETAIWCLTGVSCVMAAQRVIHDWGIRIAPSKVVPFLLVLLGRPFSLAATPSIGQAGRLGAAVIALFSVLVLVSFRRHDLSPWAVVGLSGLAGAILIALARSDPRRPLEESLPQALASHYVLVVYPLAVAILAMAGRILLRWEDRVRQSLRPVPATALGLLIAVPLYQTGVASWAWLPAIRSSAATVSEGRRAILAGTSTNQQIRTAFHRNTILVRDGIKALRMYRLSCFADLGGNAAAEGVATSGEPDAIGPAVGNVDVVAGAKAEPESRFEAVLGRGWDIRGWAADDPYAGRPVDRVDLLVDGTPVASAELGRRRPDLVKRHQSPDFLFCGWRITVPASALREPREYRLEIRVRDRRGNEARFWTETIRAKAPAAPVK